MDVDMGVLCSHCRSDPVGYRISLLISDVSRVEGNVRHPEPPLLWLIRFQVLRDITQL